MLRLAALIAFFLASAAQHGAVLADETGDAERGARLFEVCAACHDLGAGATNRIGPRLNGLFGRKGGVVPGFNYSEGLVRAGVDGLIWDYDTLDAYIENPKVLVSGTRMNFDGLKEPADRADVMAWLRQFSDNPSDIPEAARTAVGTDHDVDPAILAIQGDPEYGEYLSSECTTCHQISGADAGIPSITNWPAEDFVVAMHAYKRQIRVHPVMQMMAGRLSDEEIAALASYFQNLE
jgi:cytochrome c